MIVEPQSIPSDTLRAPVPGPAARRRSSLILLGSLLLAAVPSSTVLGSGQPTVCVETFQSPDTTIRPVPIGTEVTLTMFATGVSSAFIDGVPMVPMAPDSYTLPYIAVVDATVASRTSSGSIICTWELDVDCLDPILTFVAPVGDRGIGLQGSPECSYSVRITLGSGTVRLFGVLADETGAAVLEETIPPGALIEIGQIGLPTVTDSARTPAILIVDIPTLDAGGLLVLIGLMMTAGIMVFRHRNLQLGRDMGRAS